MFASVMNLIDYGLVWFGYVDQLVSMCKYMGLAPYGPDVLLRVQLRRQLQSIEADDELIMKEGLENLSIEEIKQACIERGMRASGG
jgi:LETM1 and EF-hand domain-containing protein 1